MRFRSTARHRETSMDNEFQKERCWRFKYNLECPVINGGHRQILNGQLTTIHGPGVLDHIEHRRATRCGCRVQHAFKSILKIRRRDRRTIRPHHAFTQGEDICFAILRDPPAFRRPRYNVRIRIDSCEPDKHLEDDVHRIPAGGQMRIKRVRLPNIATMKHPVRSNGQRYDQRHHHESERLHPLLPIDDCHNAMNLTSLE